MLFLRSFSTDPYFNLAAEEYFLKQTNEDLFMLWVSRPSVIIGKHQNAMAEINYPYIVDNNILVARRLSGGGTVVHDDQNLNFTFIANGEAGKLIDFKKFVSPVIGYLKTLDVNAFIGEKNEILVGDLKISGNAEHVFKNRVLHHGTLLYNSDLERLKAAIKVIPGEKYFDKAVQSNRASVANIASLLKEKLTIDDFISGLFGHMKSISDEVVKYELKQDEIASIQKLANDKYKTTEWIFGYSPDYKFTNQFQFECNYWEVEFTVRKGIIQTARIYQNSEELVELNADFIGKYHLYESVYLIIVSAFPQLQSSLLNELTYCFF